MTGVAAAVAAAQPWRALPPPAVRRLRAVGAHDRRVLPRWHVRNAITPRANEGAYGRIPAWQSRRHWLDVVVDLVVEHRPDVLATHNVSADTFRLWARTESLYADRATGRRCIVRPWTVARLAEVSERTVQRCRAAARALGILRDVVRGRMLRLGEILAARWRGSSQRGLANESAFTVPPWARRILDTRPAPRVVENPQVSAQVAAQLVGRVTPTSGAAGATCPAKVTGTSLQAKGKEEPASPAQQRRQRWPAGYRLALAVRERLPWLAQCPPGRLAGVLTRYAEAHYRWTAEDVVQHVDQLNRRHGWTTPRPESVRTPWSLLARYFRDDEADTDTDTGRRPQLDPIEHHPRLDMFLWRERTERERAARAAHRSRGGCGVPGCPNC